MKTDCMIIDPLKDLQNNSVKYILATSKPEKYSIVKYYLILVQALF
jgi:hypothetical protein